MKILRKRWVITAGLAALAVVTGLFVTGIVLARRFDPYIREQAIQYLQDRFDANVEIASLKIRFPGISPFRVVLTRGRGSFARADAYGLVIRRRGASHPPLFQVKHAAFDVDLGTIWSEPKRVRSVTLEGMQINIPPRGPDQKNGRPPGREAADKAKSSVIIDHVAIRDGALSILPKEKSKVPLRFDLHRLLLQSAGQDVAMKYQAELTNPKPPGAIRSSGSFGPWDAEEPGNTPLNGEYAFERADLGVFQGIAGTLKSTGKFDGSLSSIHAKGEATIPDFRLKRSGNRVPLWTRFEVQVDGTNGNTLLRPIRARLGQTEFTTTGGVIKHESGQPRAVTLKVTMPYGNLPDLLRLAMKGPSFMEGRVVLNTLIEVPPLGGRVREKLVLDGSFKVLDGKFLRSKIQDKIDSLSRRGQGDPANEAIDEVVSEMSGRFKLDDEEITFRSLSFGVPGAAVNLSGKYDMAEDVLNFHGTLRLRAKVSQTMTGWKRWALKPVDPIFARNGAGTLLKIQVVGSSSDPKFGRDRGDKDSSNFGGIRTP